MLLVYSALSYTHPVCRVGQMSCENYCSGALVIKLYQLIDQGLKPLCHIDLTYQDKPKPSCQVSILGIKQSFSKPQLVKIALAKNHDDLNQLVSRKFQEATYLCPRK